MKATLEFVQRWSPHVWLFGSVFGVAMSGTLFTRAHKRRRALEGSPAGGAIADFWYRHSLWFLVLHAGYLVVGIIAVAKVRTEFTDLFTLFFLVITPLVLVYRSYDSLLLSRRSRADD